MRKTEAVPKSTLQAFWEGFTAPWEGWRYMWRQPSLWRYGFMPFVLNLLITGLLLVALIFAGSYLAAAIHPSFPPGWLGRVLEVTAVVALGVLAFGLAIIVWLILQGTLCGYFYSRLARQIERRLGTSDDELKDVPFSHEVADAFTDAGFLVAANAAFLLLNCVPALGAMVSAIGSYYFTCMTLGLDYLEYPLVLRGKRRAEVLAFARLHRAHTLGLGTGVAIISIVPLLSAVFLTTAVTGAVLLYHRIVAIDAEQRM